MHLYRVAQKSKPLWLVAIKIVLKPAIMARFLTNFDYKTRTRIY